MTDDEFRDRMSTIIRIGMVAGFAVGMMVGFVICMLVLS